MDRITKIESLLDSWGEARYRCKQFKEAVFDSRHSLYSQVTNLPKKLRDKIASNMGDEILSIKPIKEIDMPQATKTLFELSDGNRIEAVYMLFREGRRTLCISTQVGCACGCTFCATGSLGFIRQLSSDEIVDQVLYQHKQGKEVDNIVFMGMGEPFLNPNLFEALQTLTDTDKMAYSPRRLAISTVGIPAGIRRLTAAFPQVSLTLSLHTPFDKKRDKMMPINRQYPIEEVLVALEDHILATNRKVYIAYTLLEGENDDSKHADGVANLLKRKGLEHLIHVNLIKYNDHPRAQGFHTRQGSLELFAKMLANRGIPHVTIRHSFGNDIGAACGQLVADY
ncbi:MAG: radical SAM protein [Chlamydiota bacterium]